MQIGEVAAPATGNQDLLAGLARMVEHHHTPPTPAGRDRAQQAGGAGTQDDDIGGVHDGACVGRGGGMRQGAGSRTGTFEVAFDTPDESALTKPAGRLPISTGSTGNTRPPISSW